MTQRQSTNLEVEVTRKGYSALWESGGGASNTGSAFIIANADGSAPDALFVKTGGHLSNSDHALIIVKVGMKVISVSRHHADYHITIMSIEEIFEEDGKRFARCSTENFYYNGEWDNDLDSTIAEAVEAAKAKSESYHCRRPYWVKSQKWSPDFFFTDSHFPA